MKEWTTAHILSLIPKVAEEHDIPISGDNKFLYSNNLQVNMTKCQGRPTIYIPTDIENPALSLVLTIDNLPNENSSYWVTPYKEGTRPTWTSIELTLNTVESKIGERLLVGYCVIPDLTFDFGIAYKHNNKWTGYELPSWKDLVFFNSATFNTTSGTVELVKESVTIDYTPTGNTQAEAGSKSVPMYGIYVTPSIPSMIFRASDTEKGILSL